MDKLRIKGCTSIISPTFLSTNRNLSPRGQVALLVGPARRVRMMLNQRVGGQQRQMEQDTTNPYRAY